MSSEADDAGGIFTRTRTRKRTRAVLDSARESDTRVVTFEDIPRDIKNEILGEAKLPDPVDRALVRAVSRSMRDAVDATGRDIEKLNTSTKCRDAAKLGWLSTLKNRLRRGILHKPSVCTQAAMGGHLEIVKWARKNGCPWDKDYTCAWVARHGLLKVLKWARENGCSWDEKTCSWAAEHGQLEVPQWRARTAARGTRRRARTWQGAATSRRSWAHENDCPGTRGRERVGRPLRDAGGRARTAAQDEKTCPLAAKGGHLEVLTWARENDCPWDANTCSGAAHCGHFEVLKWAHENGCPWDRETCMYAAGGGRLEILKWVRANGCPWDWHTRAWAEHRVDVFKWVDAHGCPEYEGDEDDEYYTSSSDVYSSDDSSDDELEEEESG